MENGKCTLEQTEYMHPSELLNILRNTLSGTDISKGVFCLRGVYEGGGQDYRDNVYGEIRDENADGSIALRVPRRLCAGISDGNVIRVRGTLEFNLIRYGDLKPRIYVSELEKVSERAASKDDAEWERLIREKEEGGRRDIDGMLAGKLKRGEKPKIALVYSIGTRTASDFEKALGDKRDAYKLVEFSVDMADAEAFCGRIGEMANSVEAFDAIALMRGGGSGLDKLNDIRIGRAMARLPIPWIYGAGHVEDWVLVRRLADKDSSTPSMVGSYLKEMASKAVGERNASAAVELARLKAKYEKLAREMSAGRARNKVLAAVCAALLLAIMLLVAFFVI